MAPFFVGSLGDPKFRVFGAPKEPTQRGTPGAFVVPFGVILADRPGHGVGSQTNHNKAAALSVVTSDNDVQSGAFPSTRDAAGGYNDYIKPVAISFVTSDNDVHDETLLSTCDAVGKSNNYNKPVALSVVISDDDVQYETLPRDAVGGSNIYIKPV